MFVLVEEYTESGNHYVLGMPASASDIRAERAARIAELIEDGWILAATDDDRSALTRADEPFAICTLIVARANDHASTY